MEALIEYGKIISVTTELDLPKDTDGSLALELQSGGDLNRRT